MSQRDLPNDMSGFVPVNEYNEMRTEINRKMDEIKQLIQYLADILVAVL